MPYYFITETDLPLHNTITKIPKNNTLAICQENNPPFLILSYSWNHFNSITKIHLKEQPVHFPLRKKLLLFFFWCNRAAPGFKHVSIKRIGARDYPCNLSTAFHPLAWTDLRRHSRGRWTRAANAFLWIIAPLTWIIAPAGKLYSNLFTADRIRREFYILSFAKG